MSRGAEEGNITQVEVEEVGISIIERKRVRGGGTKRFQGRLQPDVTSQCSAQLAVDEDEQCSAPWCPLDRGCGEKCWRAGVESQSTRRRKYLGHIVDVTQVLEAQ